MIKFLLAASALVAIPALAQVAPRPAQPGVQHAMPHHGMKARVVTRAEAVALAQRLFARVDANRDGAVDRDEAALAPLGRGQGNAAPRAGGWRAQLWTMADANRDNRVTLAEATDLSVRHFDMMDSNRDGQLSADERAAGRERMRGMRSR